MRKLSSEPKTSKPKQRRKPEPVALPPPSSLRQWPVRSIAASVAVVVIVAVFSFAGRGTYVADIPGGGRIVVAHNDPPAVQAPPTMQAAPTPPSISNMWLLGPNRPESETVPEQRRAAAIHISPNALGGSLSNVRLFGFPNVLLDEGKGSRIDNFEAYR